MKAQVFSLKEQEAVRRAIAKALRTLYTDIDIEQKVYDAGKDPDKIGEQYLRLLRSSTIGVESFTVEVEDQYGGWDYWDYSADIERANHFVRLSHDAKGKIFPAVAIMNRMVMIPEGIRDALDGPTGFGYLFKPLDLQGVLCVDFEGRDAIENAVARVGVELRSEIISLARRQMTMNRIPSPDLEDLGKLLDIHVDYLEELRQDIVSPLPRLAVDIISGPARLNSVSAVVLEITKESNEQVGIVNAQIRVPWNGVEEPPTRYTERLDFSLETCHTIPITILPRAAPCCPLEVLFVFESAADAVSFPLPVILDVTEE